MMPARCSAGLNRRFDGGPGWRTMWYETCHKMDSSDHHINHNGLPG